MIKRKIVELANIEFKNANQELLRVDAIVSLEDTDADDPELKISIDEVEIALPLQDILDCLEYLGIDVCAWADKRV